MVVDDQVEIAELLQTILEDEDYTALLCTEPRQAMEQVVINHPDLLMLDVKMPFVNGWQILKELRNQPATAQLPIIMMTAASDILAEYKENLNQYQVHLLLKPFNNRLMKNLVRESMCVVKSS
jgi:two-component system alkaline phosphatase synthesis response regulator PhoP/two-component system response regulator VicR